jgi:hypothetical protein
MADSVVFSQQQAQRIWAAVRQMERIGRNETGYARARPVTTSEESVYLFNTSDEIIPPYGACVCTQVGPGNLGYVAVTQTSNGAVLAVRPPKPNDDLDGVIIPAQLFDVLNVGTTSVVFNSSLPIGPRQYGKAQTGHTIIIRFFGSVPTSRSLPARVIPNLIRRPFYVSLNSEVDLEDARKLRDPFSLVSNFRYERKEDGSFSQTSAYIRESIPICRVIGEIQKFDSFPEGIPSSQEFLQNEEEDDGFDQSIDLSQFEEQQGSDLSGEVESSEPLTDDLDSENRTRVRYCIAERVNIEESPVFGLIEVDKDDVQDTTLGNLRGWAKGRLLYSDNYHRKIQRLQPESDEPEQVVVVFEYLLQYYFREDEQKKVFRCILGKQGNFTSLYQGATFSGFDDVGGTYKYWSVIDSPIPFGCGEVKDCLEDEDFDFCDLVAGCLDDEDFHDLICDKVKECLGLEEDEDIDDRIDQRLQELCTCETFIDGVSISGNDWVFTTNEICYVACPDGGGGAGDSIIIEGTDCPEDEPGDPVP